MNQLWVQFFLLPIKQFFRFFDEFWFAKRDLFGLGVMRAIVAASMAFLALTRHPWLEIMFSKAHAIVPLELAPKMIPQYYRPTFFYYIWTDAQLPWAHLSYILLLIILAMGLSNRFFTMVAWILHVGFMQRNYSMVFGADLIGGLWLFYLAWTQANESFTVKTWIYKKLKKAPKIVIPDLFSNAGIRMIQLQLCVIYAYTGWEKLKGQSWWEGTSLWSVLGNPQMAITDFSGLLQFPWIITILVYTTLIFEIYFPLLVFNEKLRKLTLLTGIGFHLGIAITMKGLWPFSLIMLAAYPVFTRYNLRIKA